MNPLEVNPKNFSVEKILYDDGDFSIVSGVWAGNEYAIAMRWNGSGDVGYPNAFGNPMWFIIPGNLHQSFLVSVLGNPSSNKENLLQALNKII